MKRRAPSGATHVANRERSQFPLNVHFTMFAGESPLAFVYNRYVCLIRVARHY